jgi:hypothetical protein
MKSIVDNVFTIALLTTMLFGFAEGITFGIKAGINIANFHGDHAVGFDSRVGYSGGGFLIIGLSNPLAIQPEAIYTQTGGKWEISIRPQGYLLEGTVIYNYLEIPVLLKFMLPPKGGVKPNLFAGPYFAVNINAKEKREANGNTLEVDVDRYVKDTDFGFVLGGGVDFELKKGKIVFDCRYTLGLTTTSEEEIYDQKNKVISFLLGYSF